ncbi:ATP-binding protein [Desulfobacter postgatei]|uniref:AAA-ATPase-like domain-containing protein n=1 Tax=Desulfobacter postgatei 2ac9 TaxID=879212 RepID=I5B4I9_9BACT|nr:Protein of unknown function (DUF1703) [Desulfobacter postgatei 2ac9]
MKKLPVGISNLKEIIEQGYAYVDKSRFVYDLVERGKYYFLARPGRFGKSLFVDTLKEAFEGNKALFQSLWLCDNWDWEKRFPVIHISFAEGVLRNRAELDGKILTILDENQKRLGITCEYQDSISSLFSGVIRKAKEKYGLRTVVLIDEYDKPILDNITEPIIAEEMREGLKNLYSVIKGQDANIQFAFLTGVSKFSKVSLFSGLNNLTDISLDPEYSASCGYSEDELTQVFSNHLKNKSREDIRKWYNGYSWLGEKVYNPFSILNYLRTGAFRNYWFETGTPTFLINLLKKNRYYIPGIENIEASESLIGAFDIDFIEPENLLFQAGYLTIEQGQRVAGKIFYKLRYPNMEVKASLSDYILNRYSHDRVVKEKVQLQIYRAFQENNPDALNTVFQALFSSIPHDWYRKNKLFEYEGYYASVFYCYFTALGLDVTAEDTTSHGRIDMTVRIDGRIYIFEFKVVDVDKSQQTALNQIKQKGYADKYRGITDEIYLIGVEFDRGRRNIIRFEWEQFSQG